MEAVYRYQNKGLSLAKAASQAGVSWTVLKFTESSVGEKSV